MWPTKDSYKSGITNVFIPSLCVCSLQKSSSPLSLRSNWKWQFQGWCQMGGGQWQRAMVIHITAAHGAQDGFLWRPISSLSQLPLTNTESSCSWFNTFFLESQGWRASGLSLLYFSFSQNVFLYPPLAISSFPAVPISKSMQKSELVSEFTFLRLWHMTHDPECPRDSSSSACPKLVCHIPFTILSTLLPLLLLTQMRWYDVMGRTQVWKIKRHAPSPDILATWSQGHHSTVSLDKVWTRW